MLPSRSATPTPAATVISEAETSPSVAITVTELFAKSKFTKCYLDEPLESAYIDAMWNRRRYVVPILVGLLFFAHVMASINNINSEAFIVQLALSGLLLALAIFVAVCDWCNTAREPNGVVERCALIALLLQLIYPLAILHPHQTECVERYPHRQWRCVKMISGYAVLNAVAPIMFGLRPVHTLMYFAALPPAYAIGWIINGREHAPQFVVTLVYLVFGCVVGLLTSFRTDCIRRRLFEEFIVTDRVARAVSRVASGVAQLMRNSVPLSLVLQRELPPNTTAARATVLVGTLKWHADDPLALADYANAVVQTIRNVVLQHSAELALDGVSGDGFTISSSPSASSHPAINVVEAARRIHVAARNLHQLTLAMGVDTGAVCCLPSGLSAFGSITCGAPVANAFTLSELCQRNFVAVVSPATEKYFTSAVRTRPIHDNAIAVLDIIDQQFGHGAGDSTDSWSSEQPHGRGRRKSQVMAITEISVSELAMAVRHAGKIAGRKFHAVASANDSPRLDEEEEDKRENPFRSSASESESESTTAAPDDGIGELTDHLCEEIFADGLYIDDQMTQRCTVLRFANPALETLYQHFAITLPIVRRASFIQSLVFAAFILMFLAIYAFHIWHDGGKRRAPQAVFVALFTLSCMRVFAEAWLRKPLAAMITPTGKILFLTLSTSVALISLHFEPDSRLNGSFSPYVVVAIIIIHMDFAPFPGMLCAALFLVCVYIPYAVLTVLRFSSEAGVEMGIILFMVAGFVIAFHTIDKIMRDTFLQQLRRRLAQRFHDSQKELECKVVSHCLPLVYGPFIPQLLSKKTIHMREDRLISAITLFSGHGKELVRSGLGAAELQQCCAQFMATFAGGEEPGTACDLLLPLQVRGSTLIVTANPEGETTTNAGELQDEVSTHVSAVVAMVQAAAPQLQVSAFSTMGRSKFCLGGSKPYPFVAISTGVPDTALFETRRIPAGRVAVQSAIMPLLPDALASQVLMPN